MSILHCCPKTGFCFQFVISLELWVELLERDSQPPRTKPTAKIKERVQTGSFNKEDINAPTDIFPRKQNLEGTLAATHQKVKNSLTFPLTLLY